MVPNWPESVSKCPQQSPHGGCRACDQITKVCGRMPQQVEKTKTSLVHFVILPRTRSDALQPKPSLETQKQRSFQIACFPLIVGTPVSPESPRCYLCPQENPERNQGWAAEMTLTARLATIRQGHPGWPTAARSGDLGISMESQHAEGSIPCSP